jgi:acyl-CoA thioesterase I
MIVKNQPAPMRTCFFGDSFVNGTGDDSCLGWVGRVCAASRQNGRDLTCYNLGIRSDTSGDILRRWRREAEIRLPPEQDGRLVFSFGANDCCVGEDRVGVRVHHAQTVANARDILSAARAWRPTLMVSPLPVRETATDRRIADLVEALAMLCVSLDIPYLNVFDSASESVIWADEVAAGDGAHPNQGGYTIIAEVFRRWGPWLSWDGV